MRSPERADSVVHPSACDEATLRADADDWHDTMRQWAFGAEFTHHPSSPAPPPPGAGVAAATAGSDEPSPELPAVAVTFEAGVRWLAGLRDEGLLPLPLSAKCRYLALDLAREAGLRL